MAKQLPTARLSVPSPTKLGIAPGDAYNEHVNAAILAKAAQLAEAGERPRFEVWFSDTTADDCDAVEVDVETGEISTLPAYEELGA